MEAVMKKEELDKLCALVLDIMITVARLHEELTFFEIKSNTPKGIAQKRETDDRNRKERKRSVQKNHQKQNGRVNQPRQCGNGYKNRNKR